MFGRKRKSLRIFYLAGYGNVIGTYRYWKQGEDDQTIVAIAYSSQFFEICKKYNAKTYIVSSWKEGRKLNDENFKFRERMIPWVSKGSWRYMVGQCWYAFELMVRAVLFRTDVIVLSTGVHHFLFSPLRMFGIGIISSMHNTLWPAGCSAPHSVCGRLILRLSAWYWRHIPSATICVSAEIERQIRKLACHPKGEFHIVRAQYRRGFLDKIDPPPAHQLKPFRIMYAGRVEHDKGVFDLLATAEILEQQQPGQYEWSICGYGSAFDALAAAVEKKGLGGIFKLQGRLNHGEMAKIYGWCHIVVVPTTSQFSEGLNKVVVEGVLARRPVITSYVCAASEFVNEAIMIVPPDRPEVYAEAIRHLASDEHLYEFKSRACRVLQDQFYNRQYAWGTALDNILADVFDWRTQVDTEATGKSDNES